MFNQIQTMENFNPHSMTEQELLNELLIADKKDKGEVKWGVVPEKIIADGKRYIFLSSFVIKTKKQNKNKTQKTQIYQN